MAEQLLRSSKLRHVHFPSIVSYHHIARLQERLARQFLDHKAGHDPINNAPLPTLFTFSPHPIYTTGRRELHKPLQNDQIKSLQKPMRRQASLEYDTADVTAAKRGGQITFHGPGQLVIYPIMDLRTMGLSPRTHICMLEKTTISFLKQYGITARTCEHPGVWLSKSDEQGRDVEPDHKIAAVGVHLRRNITSHGLGLNLCTDLRWFKRIVACGLEGKGVTSVIEQMADPPFSGAPEDSGEFLEEAAQKWTAEYTRSLGMASDNIVSMTEMELLETMEGIQDTNSDD